MKKVYLGFSGALGLVGLILAFENIMTQSPGMMIFFDTVTGTLFWPLILIFLVGFGSGLFFGLYLGTDKKKAPTDFGGNLDI